MIAATAAADLRCPAARGRSGYARFLCPNAPLHSLRALVISLYKERHGEDADFISLRQFMRRASALEDQRNQIAHSTCAADAGRDTVARIKRTAKERRGAIFGLRTLQKPI